MVDGFEEGEFILFIQEHKNKKNFHYKTKLKSHYNLILNLIKFSKEYSLKRLKKYNRHTNPNKAKSNLTNIIIHHKKFKIITTDIIMPPKSVYKTMLVDIHGYFVPKDQIVYLFIGVKQLIFSKDEQCMSIVELAPLEDFYTVFMKGKNEQFFNIQIHDRLLEFQFVKNNQARGLFKTVKNLLNGNIVYENIIHDMPSFINFKVSMKFKQLNLKQVKKKI